VVGPSSHKKEHRIALKSSSARRGEKKKKGGGGGGEGKGRMESFSFEGGKKSLTSVVWEKKKGENGKKEKKKGTGKYSPLNKEGDSWPAAGKRKKKRERGENRREREADHFISLKALAARERGGKEAKGGKERDM